MDKGKFTDEARHIQQLISTKRDVCLPARRYLVNELSLRQKNYMPLTDWKPKCGARKLNYRVADTTLTECRLISDTRIVLRGILKFFFKLFEEDKATTQNIDIHNFLVAPQTLKIVTVDVTFVDYSPSARSTSIVQLTKIIKKFVGENDLPKDVIHLLDYLQTHESPRSREEVVLLHPCTYANCTLAAFLTYIHSLYSCAVKKRNQAVLYNFRAIAQHMTRPTLPRILVDPSSNLWKSRYDDTANRNMHNPDFGGPLGVMIFMRHGLVHEDVKQEKAKNPRTLDAVENDLYVFFPTYVPNFVRYMIELNLFRGCWMS